MQLLSTTSVFIVIKDVITLISKIISYYQMLLRLFQMRSKKPFVITLNIFKKFCNIWLWRMYDNVTFRRLKIIFRATCCFPFKMIFCVSVNTAKNVILIVPLIHLTNREINLSYKRKECHMISLRENGRSFCTSNIWHNHSHTTIDSSCEVKKWNYWSIIC